MFKCMINGWFARSASDYNTFGRYDIMLEPHNKEDNAFILEFKVFNPRRDKNLEDTAAVALQQCVD